MPNGAGCWQVVELGLSLHSLYPKLLTFLVYHNGCDSKTYLLQWLSNLLSRLGFDPPVWHLERTKRAPNRRLRR